MSNIKLGIRVRPFTEKELKIEKEPISVINIVNENTVSLTNFKVSLSGAGDSRQRVRKYHADYTFDSSCPPHSPMYASQQKVFDAIGPAVLNSVTNGFSACVLAYGQSATGKTYTMMGTETQPGLIPQFCLAFANMKPLDLKVSYLEIYNEKVQDLLSSEVLPCSSLPRKGRRGNSRKDLRVREHPTQGPYVQNLRRVQVHDVEALLSIVSEGKRRRRTAATCRNSTSSRSHALLELTTPQATLQLVDLAGSEKSGAERYGSSRLKEGANINKSLVAFSNVISALVKNNGRGSRFVPYRDSVLTWLLRDCFTGGANTFIIATVSPSQACYSESASTLRWAASALNLPAKRHTASNSTSKTALQILYKQLLAELDKHHILYIPETGKISFDKTHWMLKSLNLENIGNIMNLPREQPLANSQSSISPSITEEDTNKTKTKMDTKHNLEICNEVNEEIDKLFGPTLERTRSSSDFEVIAPLRHKRRQFRSQEILTTEGFQTELNSPRNNEGKKVSSISILHDNQRAEIIASVTERLYSKLKKKENNLSKIENLTDKKTVQPLNELKICSNARQRLIEISQKALRNKRKIGIPDYTQTKKFVVRVKDQGTDVQTDLLSYLNKNDKPFTRLRDVGTETISLTPRYKEIGVGSNSTITNISNCATMTDIIYAKSSHTMTTPSITNQQSTQTLTIRPPRRIKQLASKSKFTRKVQNIKNNQWTHTPQPVININISPEYKDDSTSDDSEIAGRVYSSVPERRLNNYLPPDILNNHEPKHETAAHKVKPHLIKQSKSNISNTLDMTKSQHKLTNNEAVPSNSQLMDPPHEDESLPSNSDTEYVQDQRDIEFDSATSCVREQRFVLEEEFSFSSDLDYSDSEVNGYSKETTSNSSQSLNSLKNDSERVSYWMRSNSFRTEEKVQVNGNIASRVTPVNNYNEAKAKVYKEVLGLKNEVNRNCSVTKQNPHQCNECCDYQGIKTNNITKNIKERSKHLRKKTNKEHDSFDNVERQIKDSCDQLELAVNTYECYLENNIGTDICSNRQIKSPTEYLKHLIAIRRELVQEDRCCNLDEY